MSVDGQSRAAGPEFTRVPESVTLVGNRLPVQRRPAESAAVSRRRKPDISLTTDACFQAWAQPEPDDVWDYDRSPDGRD